MHSIDGTNNHGYIFAVKMQIRVIKLHNNHRIKLVISITEYKYKSTDY